MTRVAIPLGGWVARSERPMLAAAAGQLGEALAEQSGRPWPVSLDADAATAPLLIAGLLAAAESDEPVDQVGARLGDRFAAARKAGCEAIFVCTLFRAAADRAIRPRLRALNLMAVALSHRHGVGVIDIDRVFALFGARALQTDYRLGGVAAPEVAGHVIASALLANGLDNYVPADLQERAIVRHGGIQQIAATVDRRLNGLAARPRAGNETR